MGRRHMSIVHWAEDNSCGGIGAMTTVFDVAKYILEKMGKPISTWKLQKLVYYSQAWSLVWDERPLFDSKIKAWANGPVCPELYHAHKGRFAITADEIAGNSENLDDDARETIDAVIEAYGHFNGQQLSDLTHSEDPWRLARKGVPDNERSDKEITLESMAEYYSSLHG